MYFDQYLGAKLIFVNLLATTIISIIVLILWVRKRRSLGKTQNSQNPAQTQNKDYTAFTNQVDMSFDTM